jgi:antitoxin (DNA-binding transcriptional repressor) of toxin-antitoxin stability system
MKKLELAKASLPLSKYTRDLNGGTVVVTEDGRPIAALVSLKNTGWETISLSANPRFLAILERSHQRYVKEGGITTDQMRHRLAARKRRRGGPKKETNLRVLQTSPRMERRGV